MARQFSVKRLAERAVVPGSRRLRLRHLIAAGLVLALTACGGSSRYSMKQDAEPDGGFDPASIPPLIVKHEPKSRGGNKSPYTVWGKQYAVMDSAQGYSKTGIASWYGAKFHGHATSNGEIYNMYAYSAAHKNLPLPTFVRVTNLDNDKSVIVRVNDRGPFHGDRLIDLSYAAALSLDIVRTGTGRVSIEALQPNTAIDPVDSLDMAIKPPVELPGGPKAQSQSRPQVQPPPRPEPVQKQLVRKTAVRYLQIGAFSSSERAASIRDDIQASLNGPASGGTNNHAPVFVEATATQERMLHRVRIGPLDPAVDLDLLQSKLAKSGYSGTLMSR